jgi:hypothetical protein
MRAITRSTLVSSKSPTEAAEKPRAASVETSAPEKP